MLSLSQTTGYAILALSCLDSTGDKPVLARQIAACTDISLPYLSKILHFLTQSGLIGSKRGYRGGFILNRPAGQITLLDVAVAIEGDNCLPKCMLGLSDCGNTCACPMQEFWNDKRTEIELELRRLTIEDVTKFELKHGMRLTPRSCTCVATEQDEESAEPTHGCASETGKSGKPVESQTTRNTKKRARSQA